MGSLATLFGAALLAATVFPAQSEALLTFMLLQSHFAPWLLVAVASVGNVLGSCFNWLLGRALEHFKDRAWFPVKPQALARAQKYYAKYGRWSLLLSWVPFIGDPLTMAAGVMKERFWIFVAWVSLGKTTRYAVLAWLVTASQS